MTNPSVTTVSRQRAPSDSGDLATSEKSNDTKKVEIINKDGANDHATGQQTLSIASHHPQGSTWTQKLKAIQATLVDHGFLPSQKSDNNPSSTINTAMNSMGTANANPGANVRSGCACVIL